ncbi:hypothetical protein MASR2M78_15360 [Treponema sp.]
MGDTRDLNLESKKDFIECMERVYAWYECKVLDRVPVRFAGHNEEFNTVDTRCQWDTIQERWFDVEYGVEVFLQAVKEKDFLGETFPVFWPNLGPNVFAAMLGGSIEFGDVTSWVHPFISNQDGAPEFKLHEANRYYKKLHELTEHALSRCDNQFIVGYTDMHPGLDCVDAMYGTEKVCMGIYDEPDFIKTTASNTFEPFMEMMNRFHRILKEKRQPSVSWLNIPSFETMHIPSCDLGTMLSKDAFNEFALPNIQKEIKQFKHNIFHVDGVGVARHIDTLLDLSEIQGFQWVQGVGNDKPIMQWLDFIKKIQNRNKGIVVDLETNELDDFLANMKPKGIYLCINETDVEVQKAILKKLRSWK